MAHQSQSPAVILKTVTGWERGKAAIADLPAAVPLSHTDRKHSKLPCSGAERWTECPGSVHLSEGIPDKDTPWSIEGTTAHEVLECLSRVRLGLPADLSVLQDKPKEMLDHADSAAQFLVGLAEEHPYSDCQVETRVHLPFIHPEMFGTFDGAVIDYFGTLHVLDFKFGITPVSPVRNLQMVCYGMGLAHLHHWNFKSAKLWIIQPRVRNYIGPVYWELPITELRAYIPKFQKAVKRVFQEKDTFKEGPHCRFCKAKPVCPLKREAKQTRAQQIFSSI